MENKISNQIPITMPNSRPRNLKGKPSTSASFTFQENTQTPIHDEREVIETDPKVTQSIFEYLSSFPPGYRFNPTDVELIRKYLRPKIANKPLPPCLIHPVNLYNFHPKDLAVRYLKHPNDDEVYYFTPRDRKYKNGSRPNRGVDGVGYWKATGAEVKIMLGDEIIGFVRKLTFYEGSPKTGIKTNWIMQEYRTCESRKRTSNEDMKLDDWILCKIREKEETGPSKNKNEQANENTSISDTDIENTLTNVNAVEDVNVIIDYDEVDNLLNTRYCSEEGNCINANYCSTSYCNEQYQPNQEMGLPLLHSYTNLLDTCRENINMGNDNCTSGGFSVNLSCGPGTSGSNANYCSEEGCLSANYCSTSYCNEQYQPNQEMGLPLLHSYPNLLDTCRENINMGNDNCTSGGFSDNLSCGPGTSGSNANYCSTSYCNEQYQPNQETGLPSLHSSPNLLDTFREKINMGNDNCTSGGFSDNLSCGPGTSGSNALLRDDADMYDLWESYIVGNNDLDCLLTVCDDSYDFQDSSSDLKNNDADDEKHMDLQKR